MKWTISEARTWHWCSTPESSRCVQRWTLHGFNTQTLLNVYLECHIGLKPHKYIWPYIHCKLSTSIYDIKFSSFGLQSSVFVVKVTLYSCCCFPLLAVGGTAPTWHALQQLGVAHLTLPDVREDVLHSFRPPQEVKHTQIMTHTLAGEHLKQVWQTQCSLTPFRNRRRKDRWMHVFLCRFYRMKNCV